jgi:hypothetical protein
LLLISTKDTASEVSLLTFIVVQCTETEGEGSED